LSFRVSHGELLDGLSSIRKRILSNNDLFQKIIKKYSIKNVTGYAINSFLKAEDPIDIIKYLMVGSEGTLAFMKEITLNTVENYKDRASALILFPTLKEACEAITVLKQDCEKEVDAGELLDKVALKAISNKPGLPDYLKGLEGDETALLIETRAASKEELQKNIEIITKKVETKETVVPVSFTDKKEEYMNYWQIRKGVFPASVGNREKGTTSVIEDIACPIEHLAEMATRLQGILQSHKYENTVIYGHALEG
ncbi:MAG: 4Fe-4S ferredoxin, partial [Campylobacterales bacterium]|nr:4Fe-4S ferredoxin [Campylobacterales bacterium]